MNNRGPYVVIVGGPSRYPVGPAETRGYRGAARLQRPCPQGRAVPLARAKHMTEPTWRRQDLFRKRLERQCEKLIAEAVRAGDIELMRSHRIKLAALRFAFDGSAEAHRRLSAFYFEDHRSLSDG